MRDRLIELLKGAETKVAEALSRPLELEEWLGIYADYLLANGVIVPPCKVGTRVYVMTSQTSNGKNFYIFEDTITHYRIFDGCVIMCFENHLGEPNWNWNKVFLTREEAERALKGGEG